MKDKKFYPWLVVALLWVVALLNYMDRQMLSTMQQAMGMDIVELQSAEAFGFLMSVFLIIYGVMSPISGFIGDRLNRKWLIVGSLFVWSAVTLLMGFAQNYDQVLFLRAFMGVSEALYMPAGLALIADYHTGKSRSLAVGVHMTGIYMGQALGGFGATLAASFSWHTAFHLFGLIGCVYALVLIVFLKEKERNVVEPEAFAKNPTKKENPLKVFSLLLSSLPFWIILIYFSVPSLPGWATKNWLPTLFASNLDIPMSQAGPMATITIAMSSFIGVLIGGSLSDRWVKRNLKGRVYTGAIGLGLTIPSLILLGIGNTLPVILAAGMLFGIGFGIFDTNNMPILCQFVAPRHRATAYGILNMAGVFAGSAITYLLGRWNESGMSLGTGFAVLSIIVLVALGLQLYFLNPTTDNKE